MLRRRDSGKAGGLPRLPQALVITEEERAVPDDGAANDAAELIAVQRWLAGGRYEEAGGVQGRRPEELPPAPVQLVRAAPVIDVDRRPGRAAVFRAHVVRDDLELADRVRRRLHDLVREPLVAGPVGVVVDAVDHEIVERAAQAVHIEGALARRVAGRQRRSSELDAGRQERQRRVLAGDQRKGARLIAGDHLAALARVGLDERARGGDLHFLCELADGHLQIHTQTRANLDLNVVHERDGEAGLLGGHDVEARLDGGELVVAVAARCLDDGDARFNARQRHFRRGNNRARRVADGADDGRRIELRQGIGCRQDEDAQTRKNQSHATPLEANQKEAVLRREANRRTQRPCGGGATTV